MVVLVALAVVNTRPTLAVESRGRPRELVRTKLLSAACVQRSLSQIYRLRLYCRAHS
jgi:hypothetical protein